MNIQKKIGIVLCVAALGMAAGCGSESGTDSRQTNQPTGVNDVLQAGISQENAQSAGNGTAGKLLGDDAQSGTETAGHAVPDSIDVDLTKLSSTMVYSEVFNMMSKPEDYIGKTIKMDGQFTVYHDDTTGNNYFACIIQDATACCAQGMEFVLTEDYSYPKDYPSEGDEVAVVGVFDTYMEGDYKYCTLKDAVLTN